MFGFATLNLPWHDAIFERIKPRKLCQEAAPLCVNPIISLALRVEDQVCSPVVRRIGDGVYLSKNVFPERAQVRGLREDTCHANNSDLSRRRAHGMCNLALLSLNRFSDLLPLNSMPSIIASRHPASS